MRSATAPELAVLAAASRTITQRVKIANGSGTLVDLTSWVEEVTHNVDLDRPVSALTIHFRRDSGTIISLSPLRTDSSINRLDDGTTYSPQIAGGRRVTWEVATTAIGTAIVGGDYKLLFDGYTDEDDSSHSPLTVECRDKGGVIVDRGIEVEAGYGSLAGVAVETVMQQILDATFGSGFIPLDVIGSPSFLISNPSHPSGQYIQQRQSMMDAMQALAQLPAWDVRYWWDSGSSTFKFRLQQPPRTKTTPDHTLGPNAYHDVVRFGLARKDIRNVIGLEYFDTIADGRLTVPVSDAPSIAKYGRRYFFLREADDSPINTNAEATAMANGILSDLKEPKAEAEIDMPFFWPAELWDLYRFSANGVHINSDQDWAVVSITHKLARGRHRTILTVRGAPAGGYLTWLDRPGIAEGEHRPGEVGPEAKIETFGPPPSETVVTIRYSATGGTAPLNYQRRLDVEGVTTGSYSAAAALGSGVTENITRHAYLPTRVYLRVIDATGLQGNADPFFIAGEMPAMDKTSGKIKPGTPMEGGDYPARANIAGEALTIEDQGVLATLDTAAVSLSIGACYASNAGSTGPPFNQLEVPFTFAGMPPSVTFDVGYNNSVAGGTGYTTGLTASPATFTSVTFNGSPGDGAVTVIAKKGGVTIATAIENGLYAT